MTPEERQDENTEQNPVHRLITERDLTELVQQYGRYLQRYFLTNGVPRDDVNDLVQDTFTVAWTRRGEYDSHKVKAFLHGTARNIMLAHNRKHYGRRTTQAREIDAIIKNLHPCSLEKTPKHVFMDAEWRHTLSWAVLRLPSQLQNIVHLRYLCGFSREQAAKMLGISSGTLYRRERRALIHLKRILSDLEF